MESLDEKKLNESEVFDRWIADVRADGSIRYTYEDRKRHLENLMGFLKIHNIAKDDAQFLKKRVVETLVTKEGLKGKGKHSGWKENTENDFNDYIQRLYVPGLPAADFKRIKTAQGYDPRIVSWAKAKFGDHLGQDMINAAHQPLHTLWNMFMLDTFPEEFKKGVK